MTSAASCLFFFLSGLCALVYEVAWVRELGLVLGSTAQATSGVLAVYMGGLALGSLTGGKIADRLKDNLRAYGVLEIVIGLAAPAVSWLVALLPALLASITGGTAGGDPLLAGARFCLSAALLLVPTLLMGATLPVLTRYLSDRCLQASQPFTLLYGLNTLGAAAGSLAACFYGFAYLGIEGTIWLAAALNIAVGGAAVLLSWVDSAARIQLTFAPGELGGPTDAADDPGAPSEPSGTGGDPSGPREPRAATGEPGLSGTASIPARWLYLLACLTGFAALAYEVVWTRLLRLYLTSSTYAFTIMLSAFLLGLALGSLIYHRWSASQGRADGPRRWTLLCFMQFATAVSCAGTLLLLPAVPSLRDVLGMAAGAFLLDRAASLTVQAVLSAVFLLLPATIIGVSFPLIGGLAADSTRAVGSAVGKTYAANTAGCILGSLVAGLVLMPGAGSQTAFQMVVGVSIAATCLAVAAHPRLPLPAKALAVSLTAAAYSLFLIFMPPAYAAGSLAARMGGELLSLKEDTTGIVMVVGFPGFRKLVVNGEPYSSTVLHGQRYMRMIGHLPQLLHPRAEKVLSVCFGTGTTAGAASLHREVKRLDLVELSAAVLATADFFSATNHNVLRDPRTHVFVDDGRNFLLRSKGKYDVISFEAPPPYDAGVVSLYSTEFYRLVRDHLEPGGIMCQWVPMALQAESLWKMMITSATEVFPEVTVWAPNNREALLIASDRPIEISRDGIAEKIRSNRDVQASLKEIGLADPYAILGTWLIGGERLRSYLADAPAITDDRPRLEFFLPFTDNMAYPADLESPEMRSGVALPDEIATRARGFEPARLAPYAEAMHLLRLASQALAREGDLEQAKAFIERAYRLFPDNRFFQYARHHPRTQR